MDLMEIVQRAQTGDQEAMGELYQQTNQRVYALALRLTGNPELAMDAVQDSYVAAMQNLDKLREPKAIFQWLFQIVTNRCRKLQKKEGRYLSPQQDEEDGRDFFDTIPDPDEKLLPETAADDGETRRLLMDMVNSLPREQQECIVLFYFSQCPLEQIAQIQNCSEGTVKSRLNYGRKKLKDAVLALEARDGIRLHTLAPVGLLFRLTMKEAPDPDTLANVWHTVAAQLGTAAAAGGGTAAAAAAGNSASTTAGGAAAAKGAVGGAVKLKIAAGVVAGAVAVGGVGVTLHQPSVTFTDPAFEQNIRILLGKPEGAIRPKDLEGIHFLCVMDDGMADSWGQNEAWPVAEEGTTSVSSLEDITLLTGLSSLNYFVPDRGALLDTVGEHETLNFFSSYYHASPGSYLEDLTFLEQFPNLQHLTVYVTSGTDLAPVESKSSLTSLSIYTDEDGSLDVSQLTGLYSLHFGVAREGTLELETSAELPQLRILDLFGGMAGPPVLGFVENTPALEFANLQQIPDTDLTPLSRLTKLRAILLGYDSPFDLTSLVNCPSLEVCYIPSEHDVIVPDGLPTTTDRSVVDAIWLEIEQEIRE